MSISAILLMFFNLSQRFQLLSEESEYHLTNSFTNSILKMYGPITLPTHNVNETVTCECKDYFMNYSRTFFTLNTTIWFIIYIFTNFKDALSENEFFHKNMFH